MTAIVLLPGLDGTGRLFSPFAEALRPFVEVIVASYPPSGFLSYGALDAVARAFLPEDQPYYLLAESFSGPVAVAIAASPPPGLRGVILCCSFARNPLPLLAPARAILRWFPLPTPPVALLSPVLLGRFATSALEAELASALALVTPKVLRERAREALAVDAGAELASVRVPFLYLRATEDRVVPQTSSEHVMSCAPKCEVLDFVAPHFLLQAVPAEAAAAVLAFMGRVDGTSCQGR